MPDVRAQVREAVRQLRGRADAERASGMAWYFQNDPELRFFGIKTPDVRTLEKQQFKTLDDDLNTALAFADAMMRRRELESKIYACARLHHYRGAFTPQVLTSAGRWLREGHCPSWAAVDALCHQVVSPLIDQLPGQLPRTQRWGVARALWPRRASVVVFVPFVRKGRLQDEAYEAVERHIGQPEDLMHKAMGWVLREAGNADRRRFEQFLLKRGKELARTTVRYAIEKFPEKRRKELLRRTSVARQGR